MGRPSFNINVFLAISLSVLLLTGTVQFPPQMDSPEQSSIEIFDSLITDKMLQEAFAIKHPKTAEEKQTQGLLQRAIISSMEQLKEEGKPEPKLYAGTQVQAQGADVVIKSNTVIEFDNPKNFGKDKWGLDEIGTPEQIKSFIDESNVRYLEQTGDSHYYINDDDGDGLTDEDPVNGIDDDGDQKIDEDPVGLYEFDTQPITIRISESFEATLPSEDDADAAVFAIDSGKNPFLVIGQAQIDSVSTPTTTKQNGVLEFISTLFSIPKAHAVDSTTTKQNVVMGFQASIPLFPGGAWNVDITAEIAGADFAWYRHQWTLFFNYGLRLPIEASITTVDPMIDTRTYGIDAQITPLNLDAAGYEAVGLPGFSDPSFNDDEFVANLDSDFHVEAGIFFFEVLNADLDVTIDFVGFCTSLGGTDCSNFTTPFGSNSEFPLPTFTLPCNALIQGCEIGIPEVFTVTVGLVVDPNFTSEKITATRNISGDALPDSETFGFTSTSSISLGSLVADSSQSASESATITETDFKYHVTRMDLVLSLVFIFEGILGDEIDPPDAINLGTVDLTSVLGEPIIGQHDDSPDVVRNVFVISPRDQKDRTINNLELLQSSLNDKGQEKIAEALEYLNESLFGEPGDDEQPWVDSIHLLPDSGDDVFGTQNDAAEKLMEIIEKPDEFGASDVVVSEIVDFIEMRILLADRTLAEVAIDEAAGGDADLIEEANEEMSKAEDAIANGEYDKAIESYHKAWEAALKAAGII